MTTATKQEARPSGMRPLVATMVLVDVVVLVVAGLAALLADGDAAVAALVGGLVVSVVVFTGTAMVNVVAGLLPSMSLLVALTTYTLQLVVMVAVFLGLSRSALGDDATSRGWLGAAVIVAALTWLVGHLVAATRARIPLYDLPVGAREGGGER